MSNGDLLPRSFAAPLAALLLRTTEPLLRRLTKAGGIASEGKQHPRFSRVEIERVLGRPITLKDYLEADRKRDARRDANRKYNVKRASVTSAASFHQSEPSR
jgi:hypothetical protein